MTFFPRTEVGGISLSRMIVGTNWFLGFSHCTAAKDAYINEHVRGRKEIADILEVFFRAGVDTVMGMIGMDPLKDAICEAEDRTGVGAVIVSTPAFPVTADTPSKGFDMAEVDRILDLEVEKGAAFCLPHVSTTDALLDRCSQTIRRMEDLVLRIRERGMVPGLSTHMPEAIPYADASGLDVETYISMYNSAGFLMHHEVDWVHRLIHNAKKPVMTIKPMAAGQLRPLQGLSFVWNTIRGQDMVTVGTMSPKEAEEVIELSRSILEQRISSGELQRTRSKASLKAV